MKPTISHSKWERLLATGTCLFLPLATLPIDIEFNTVASWYGPGFDGKKTASGEVYDQNRMTAANKELPFGTKLAVKNLKNGRSCVVVINDRGPYVRGRGIDLSREAARRIGMDGIAPVYCCSVNVTKPAVTKPRTDNTFESVDVASLTPSVEPALNSVVTRASVNVPSWAVPHRRGIARKHGYTFQYVAYLGSRRVQYDGLKTASKFVRNYRA